MVAAPIDNRIAAEPEMDTRVLTRDQGLALLDEKARRYLGVSGPGFVQRWYAGHYDDDPDRPEVRRVAALLPLAAEHPHVA